jgi:chromosome partitioning protein
LKAIKVAVISQKGGTGKTTLALNLADGLSRRGRVLIVDADPQNSLSQWVAMSDSRYQLPEVQKVDGPPAISIHQSSDTYDFVVIDCPPAIHSKEVVDLLGVVDIALIPVLPSPIDLWASVEMIKLTKKIESVNKKLSAFMVLNQVEPKSALSRAMTDALAALDTPVLAAKVSRRAAFKNAAVEGVSVYRLGKRGDAAVNDIEGIVEELLCR